MSDRGVRPDPWQRQVLEWTGPRILMLCSRQVGKTEVTAALALRTALLEPPALVLLLSPSERQSGELANRVFGYYDAIGRPIPARKRTELQLHLTNGSRIIALPENEKTIRGFAGATLLVIDEASRVSDDLYRTVRPMLAMSQGRLVALSTPFGKRGWFFEEWSQGGDEWARHRITATMCPRYTPEFLAEERKSLGERWYQQEYFCSFEDAIDSVFLGTDIAAAFSDSVQPLFGDVP